MYYSNEGIRLQHSSYENIVTDRNKLEMILIKKWEKECNSFHWGKVDNQGISKKKKFGRQMTDSERLAVQMLF